MRLVAASRLEKLVHYRPTRRSKLNTRLCSQISFIFTESIEAEPELRAAVVVVETRGLEILCRHTTFVRRPDRKVRV